MKILNSLTDVAAELKVEEWKVQKEFEKYFLKSGYMTIKDITVFFESGKGKLEYVLVDLKSTEDCREYILKYEVDRFDWEVYTDGIVGNEKCKVINVLNDRWDILRATVVTESGTQLNRVVKYVNDKEDEDYKQDGCIYFFDKE